MKKTPWIIGTATVAVLAVGGGGTAYAVSNEAAVTVYGEQSLVRSFSPTVADLLAAQGIEVQDTDLVVPGLDESVVDGMDIQVIQRTPVTVSVDGQEQELLTTGDTVEEALEELEGPDHVAEDAAITPAPETPLDEVEGPVEVVTKKTVTFIGARGQDTFEISALTVDEAMTRLLADIEDTDTADVGRDTALEDGMTVHVTRIRETERTETVEIPFETETVEDDELLEGTTRTTTEGKNGEAEKVYAETTVDGEVTESELVSETVVTEPVTEVVAKGTKPAPEPELAEEEAEEAAPAASAEKAPAETRDSGPKSTRSTERESTEESQSAAESEEPAEESGNTGASAPAAPSGSVWDRLAECESGGNWSINTGNGFSGGLQFTKSTWLAFGGGKYAPVAHQATREQQIDIAQKVQAGQGWGAWPACTSKLGIR